MSATTRRTCPECEGRLRSTGIETVCDECGLVVEEDQLDRGPEWRSFDDDETNPERCGAPLTRSRHDRGLSTEIGRSTRLKGRKRRRVARMRRQHNRTQIASKRERNLVYGFTEIRRLTGQLELPGALKEQACVLFESAQESDLLRGRCIEGFAAAAVYATCRTMSVSRTIEEVAAVASADERELKVAYGALNRELELSTGPIDPTEYLARFASELGIPNELERRARDFAREANESGITTGRNPSGVAAACLYTAARSADYELTQKEAADIADVSAVTVRNTYRDLRD
ncbi:transcription initiation factor IIB family protein [Natronomonas sp. F2-12]|jgi:transcription initiation factor TFIIB|uniref:Transcription initiation factor IIB n=1 Tax=Natronomonas aquatica TaxID=2841590 RepID=A0A9R1CVE0_9EURY|nr:transcription initiation factor IIB family protein [Natronomonas aquatica]MCQ4334296.1 transcription initiation factor IIB family protein [Natronomonas aquatica]